jgi:hypothetical protein
MEAREDLVEPRRSRWVDGMIAIAGETLGHGATVRLGTLDHNGGFVRARARGGRIAKQRVGGFLIVFVDEIEAGLGSSAVGGCHG